MKKLIEWYDRLEEKFLIFILGLSSFILMYQILMRTIFNNSPSWSEEIVKYLFIWMTWMGTSIAQREDEHIVVGIIDFFVKSEKGRKIIDIIADIIWLIFNLVFSYISLQLIMDMVGKNVLSSALRIPLWIVYISLPISLIVLSIRIILDLYIQLKGNSNPD